MSFGALIDNPEREAEIFAFLSFFMKLDKQFNIMCSADQQNNSFQTILVWSFEKGFVAELVERGDSR